MGSASSKGLSTKKQNKQPENFWQKLSKTQKIVGGIAIGVVALVIVIVAVTSGGGGTASPESIAKKYCDILVKGNYGDLLDIADFPESDLITADKIKASKDAYRERYIKENEGKEATTCTYTLASENDEKLSYKVVINDKTTQTLGVKKSNSKAVIDGVYRDADIKAPLGGNVTVDGIDISKYKVESEYAYRFYNVYNIAILRDFDYIVKSEHPLLSEAQTANFSRIVKDARITFDNDLGYNGVSVNSTSLDAGAEMTSVALKEEDMNAINKLFSEIIAPLMNDNLDGKDLNKYSQYFTKGEVKTSNMLKFNSNSGRDFVIHIYAIRGNNKITLSVGTPKSSSSQYVTLVKDGSGWKIEDFDGEE